MIIVTLVASLAAAMVWQQYRAVQIEAAERARAQSGWILQGALDWARLILLEDIKADKNSRSGGVPADHLGEVWAVPLAEARLSTFLAADRANAQADDGPEAFLSGSILDLQSRYNLRALLVGDKVAPLEKRTLERLCETAGVGPAVAETLITQLRATYGTSAPPGEGASKSSGAPPSNDAIQPVNLDQLVWLGLPADVVERLKPFVVLLPSATTVNLNTAPKEVIAALFDGMDLASAERLVQGRKARPLRNLVEDAKGYLPSGVEITAARAGVTSSFFEVTGRLRLEERQLEQRSLIERRGLEMLVLARERVAQILDTTTSR
jgi:general secretion pathway protein K